MVSFRRTAAWVLGASLVLYLLLTVAGVLFMAEHDNEHAKTIREQHRDAITSISWPSADRWSRTTRDRIACPIPSPTTP